MWCSQNWREPENVFCYAMLISKEREKNSEVAVHSFCNKLLGPANIFYVNQQFVLAGLSCFFFFLLFFFFLHCTAQQGINKRQNDPENKVDCLCVTLLSVDMLKEQNNILQQRSKLKKIQLLFSTQNDIASMKKRRKKDIHKPFLPSWSDLEVPWFKHSRVLYRT